MGNQGFRGTVARWGQWVTGSKPPRVACEIAADGVSAARRARGSKRIEAWATKPLPDGVVRPGPLAENVLDGGALGQALEGVLSEVAGGEKRVAAILPDHIPLVANLRAGELTLKKNGDAHFLVVSTGFLEVRSGNNIVILADTAERAEELADPVEH
jgi:hypothetical protein